MQMSLTWEDILETIKESDATLEWRPNADALSERSRQNESTSSVATLTTLTPTTQTASSNSLAGRAATRGRTKPGAPKKKRFPACKADLRKRVLQKMANKLIAQNIPAPPPSLASAFCAPPHSALASSLCAPLSSSLCAPLSSSVCAPLASAPCAPPPLSVLCAPPPLLAIAPLASPPLAPITLSVDYNNMSSAQALVLLDEVFTRTFKEVIQDQTSIFMHVALLKQYALEIAVHRMPVSLHDWSLIAQDAINVLK